MKNLTRWIVILLITIFAKGATNGKIYFGANIEKVNQEASYSLISIGEIEAHIIQCTMKGEQG
jgi:hypothetical protein